MIDNFQSMQETLINNNRPDDQKIKVDRKVLTEALEQVKKDRERAKWKNQLQGSGGKHSILDDAASIFGDCSASQLKFLQSKLDDIKVKRKLLEDVFVTSTALRIIMDPANDHEGKVNLYYADLHKNEAKLLLSDVQVYKQTNLDE